jgi:hypothetical protein
MNESLENGSEIELLGESGQRYTGRIYTQHDGASAISGKAIACLTNSEYTWQGWTHRVNSIYNTENIPAEFVHLQSRNDISHLILLPYNNNNNDVSDKVDDLIRNHLHR